MGRGHFILFAAVVLLAAGCSATEPLHDTHRSITFDSGSPIVDIEAYPEVVDGDVRLSVTWGVVRASLIRVNRPFGLQSSIQSEIEVYALEAGMGASYSRIDTLRYSETWQGEEFGYHLSNHIFDLAPGDYEVSVRVQDRTSGASSERSLRVSLPARNAPQPICHVRLKKPNAAAPVVAFHVENSLEGLSLVADSWGDQAELQLALVRIESDTSIAEPPFGLDRTGAAISVRGVKAEHVDTLEVRRWILNGQRQQQIIRMKPEETGVYRLLCSRGDETLATREFAVRHAGFPRVNRLDVMLDALAYLATPGEMRYLRESSDLIELKHRFDAFWLELTPNRLAAKDLLDRYYSRVQRANLLFSGIKEGWKTDRGMVYIMRGPPLYIERTLQSETWFYRYTQANPADIFVFDRVIVSGLDAVSRNLVLQRGRVYDYEWRKLISRWRRGEDV